VIGQQLGPYTIEAELGSGGMGTVYRAQGPDGTVALKVVHPHLLATPGFFKRFLREAEIGKAVRHENVVRTLDCDQLVIDGTAHAYLVMEHVAGKSLRQLLEDLGIIPETLLREIALQTADGLAAIHAAGIVHRDLKPENILITDDHEIRIMDLGVAKLQEATIELTREGQFAGSLLYAAPEQFRGDVEVGPASDLYSLGVLLYELATGDNPFHRDDHAQVIEAHLNHQPRRAYERNTETTRFLAELVACLLGKDPSKRFESADVLHHVLEEAERSTWWKTLAPVLDRKPKPKIRVRRETQLHGRKGDLELLARAWERAKTGEGNTVWIDGEAGIGKTRLLSDFLDAIEDDCHVLYGSYPPSGGLGGFSDAILDHFGDVDLEERLKPYLTVTPLLVPAFGALVKHDAPPEGAEPIQGDALNAVGVHLMRGLAVEKPTIWIVDDLHFAPKESRDLALSLSRAAEGHPVLLVYTARPGIPEEELAHFERLENFDRLSLSRLGAREVVELLQDAFKSEVLAEKLAGKIGVKSDGVPFFVFEMIRGLREGQFIREEADGSYVQTKVVEDIEVPSAVKDLIEGRLRDLSDEDRNLLDVAAVQGVEFDSDLVARVLELNRVLVLQRLAAIERRSGVVCAEGGRYRFDQNQIQEVLYASLADELRAEYHTLVAEAYVDRLAGDPTSEDAVFLASHHLRGSRPQEGLPHLTLALERLGTSFRNDAFIELATRALEAPGLLDAKQRIEVLLKKAGRHGLLAEREAQRALLEEALALTDSCEDASLRAKVQVMLGAYSLLISEWQAAQGQCERALEFAREANDRKTEELARRNLGSALRCLGRYEEAGAQYEMCLLLAREAGDDDALAAGAINLALVLTDRGRHKEAVGRLEEGLALARSCGNRRWEANAVVNLGLVLWRQGSREQARAQFEKHLDLAREIGDRYGEALGTGNLGTVFQSQGDYGQACTQLERSLALVREIGDRHGEASATGNLGSVFWDQGRYSQAHAKFESGLALNREIGDRAGEVYSLGYLGTGFWSQGDLGRARAHFEKALALSREIGSRSHEGRALLSLASLTDAEGDADTALRQYGEALAIFRELGEKHNVADTLVGFGGVELKAGEHSKAVTHLDEALALGHEVKGSGTILLGTVHRARLPGGDAEAAIATLGELEVRVSHADKLEARFHLWELTNDKTHLTEAKRLLDFAVEHSPEEYRTSMLENVPLHRDIMKAWEEYGGEE
jgi:serine/threonine protein kinase/tetratricopeptide (TPR) repeat protein